MFRLIVTTLDIQGKDKVRGKNLNIFKKKNYNSYKKDVILRIFTKMKQCFLPLLKHCNQ